MVWRLSLIHILNTLSQTFQVSYTQTFVTGTNILASLSTNKTSTNSSFYFLNPYFNSGMNLQFTQPLLRDVYKRQAPAVGGGALQITRLLAGRLPVKKGDVIIEFDPSEQLYKLEQSRSELLQAEQEIIKAKADAAVLAAQDKVALLKARYDVRQAELDVQKKEIESAIDGSKHEAALTQAKRLLAELQKDVESHNASGQASIYLAQEKYNKAKLEMDQAQQNIDKMSVVAPMDGLISIQKRCV